MSEKLQGKDQYTAPESAYSNQELLERKARYSAEVVRDLSFWVPHMAQALVGKAIFIDGKTDIVVECGRKFGKLLDLEENILTPNGFIRYGDIAVGDVVYDEMGKEQVVTELSNIELNPESFRVHFCNGTHIDACADHLWNTYTKSDRKKIKRKDRGCHPNLKTSTRTTKEIFESLMSGKEYNHQIPLTLPIEMNDREYLIDPYVLGAWLGDGGSYGGKITSIDPEVIARINSAGYETVSYDRKEHGIYRIVTELKCLKLLKNKHVPSEYLVGSINQRLALLQGLMDTDGTVNKAGNHCCFDNTNKLLSDAVFYLVASLGMKPKMSYKTGKLKGVEKKKVYRVMFRPNTKDVFHLARKRDKIILNNTKFQSHTIVNVEKIESKPMMCIAVTGESRLFLIGNALIPTHNSELGPYCQHRWAIINNKSFNYYFVPIKDQISDIIWANGRLPDFLPIHLKRKYLDGEPTKSEFRINFKNGSFIRCDGSDSYNKARGYTGNGLQIYDETKDFHPMFHDAFDPNRGVNNSPLLAMGTPGDETALLTKLFDSAKELPYGAVFNFPSDVNPHISHEFLEKKRLEYEKRGEIDIYNIEYGAKRIKIGTKYIFPMISKKLIMPHDELLSFVTAHRKDFDFYLMYDPGSVKCFGALFVAIHRFNKHVIILDEIYEKRLGENTTKKIVPQAIKKCEDINRSVDDWSHGYDYAAAWFVSDITSEFEDYPYTLLPCEKDLKDKENKLSLIKDIIIGTPDGSLMTVSDRCVNFYTEMEQYKLDDKGRLKKENDHLIDCLRYILNLASYRTLEDARPLSFTEKYKTGTIYQDLLREKEDSLYGDIDSNLFDSGDYI